MGTSAIAAFFLVGNFITECRDVRLNGDLVDAKVVSISGGRSRGINVKIGERIYHSNGYYGSLSVGDTTSVRYIAGCDYVIQEKTNPNLYYLYYALNSILLISGILFVKESFKGKSLWKYKN